MYQNENHTAWRNNSRVNTSLEVVGIEKAMHFVTGMSREG